METRGGRTWHRNVLPVMADRNTVAVLMTTVMSVHIVSGPVNPVSIKSGRVATVAVVRVPVGVPVGIILEGFPGGRG